MDTKMTTHDRAGWRVRDWTRVVGIARSTYYTLGNIAPRAAALPMNSDGNEDPVGVDIDELVRRHQRGSRSLYYRNPFRLIRDFVVCFEYTASGKAKLATRPDDSLLEVLAEAFRRYWRSKGSLDAAFGLKLVGKGRRSPREQERIRVQSFGAQAAYKALRANKVPQKTAIEEIAKSYKCSPGKARDLIFGKRSMRSKKS